MNLWIDHPRSGQPDAILSVAIYATGIVLFKFLLSNVGIGSVNFGQLDPMVVAAILTPTLGTYAARKYTSSPETIRDNAKTISTVTEVAKEVSTIVEKGH